MSNKTGTRSPAARLRSLALSRSVGRPKLRKALSVNSESELLKAVARTSLTTGKDFGVSKTPPLQRKALSASENVLSIKLQASSFKEYDREITTSSNHAENVGKQPRSGKEYQKTNSLDRKDLNSKIQEIIRQSLSAHLESMEYNHEICGSKCRTISQSIEKGVKSLYNTQYKITALVYIGAIRDRGIEISSQCVWNPKTDNFAMATLDTNSLFATGIVFATLFNDD